MKLQILTFILVSSFLKGQSIINTSAISHDLDSSLSLVLDAGADFSRGNSSVNNITSSFGVGKSLTEDASLWFLEGYNQLAVNGAVQQQAFYGHLRTNYEIRDRITLNVYGQFQSNSVLAMDSRFLSGVNVDFDFGKDQDFMIALGAFNEVENYRDGLTSNLFRGNVITVAEHKTKHIEVVGFAYFQPNLFDITDYRCIGELSFRFPITNDLQLSMNAAARFDSSPHSGLNSTDLGFTTSLRYEKHKN